MIVSALLVSVVVVYILVPIPQLKVLGSKVDMNDKVKMIKVVNAEREGLDKEIGILQGEVNVVEQDLKKSEEIVEKTNELFSHLLDKQREEDWSLHIPSLLIELERSASDKGVKIAIDYDTMRSGGAYVSSSGKGLKKVDVEVELRGGYKKVREYIKFVEGMSFINVDNLILSRIDSGILEGKYKLNVYFME